MSSTWHIQILRASQAVLDGYTPLAGELVYNTDTNEIYVGDGATQGGNPLAGLNREIVEDTVAQLIKDTDSIDWVYDDANASLKGTVPSASPSQAGLMSSADKIKLIGLGISSAWYTDSSQAVVAGQLRFEKTGGALLGVGDNFSDIVRIKMNEQGFNDSISNPDASAIGLTEVLNRMQVGGVIHTSATYQNTLYELSFKISAINTKVNNIFSFDVDELVHSANTLPSQGLNWFVDIRPKRILVTSRDIQDLSGNSKYLGTNASGSKGVFDLPEGVTNLTITEKATEVDIASSSGSGGSIAAATSTLAGVLLPEEKDKIENLKLGVWPPGYTMTRDFRAFLTQTGNYALLTTGPINDGGDYIPLLALYIQNDREYLFHVLRALDHFSVVDKVNGTILTGKVIHANPADGDPTAFQIFYEKIVDQSVGTPGYGNMDIYFSRPLPWTNIKFESLCQVVKNKTGGTLSAGQPVFISTSGGELIAKSTVANSLLEGVVEETTPNDADVKVGIEGIIKGTADIVWNGTIRLVHSIDDNTKIYYDKATGRLTITSTGNTEVGTITDSDFILPHTGYWDSAFQGNVSQTISTGAQASATRNTTLVIPNSASAVTYSLTIPNLDQSQVYTTPFQRGDRIAFVNRAGSNVTFYVQMYAIGGQRGKFLNLDGTEVSGGQYSMPSGNQHRGIVIERVADSGGQWDNWKIVNVDSGIITADLFISIKKYLANK